MWKNDFDYFKTRVFALPYRRLRKLLPTRRNFLPGRFYDIVVGTMYSKSSKKLI